MIKNVTLGEEIIIKTTNKVGILADIAMILASEGVNIEAVSGYEYGKTAVLMLVTSANLIIVSKLKKKKYKSIEETEVIMVDLEDKPGALKVITTELGKKGIDIKHLYVTAPTSDGSSKMIMKTSDDENAMALLSNYVAQKADR